MSLVPVLSAVQRCNTSPRLFVHHNPHVGDPQASGGQLAAEAADNRLLAPELADGISRVKSTKTQGIRTGNGLSQRQAQALLSAPDITTLRGLRDRAILAVLLGCGLRRSEVATLTFSISSSGTAAGASWTWSVNTVGSAPRQCQPGSRSRLTLGPRQQVRRKS
jgi:hypothetical protein